MYEMLHVFINIIEIYGTVTKRQNATNYLLKEGLIIAVGMSP